MATCDIVSLSDLPLDVLIGIASYLTSLRDLHSLFSTCSSSRALSDEPLITAAWISARGCMTRRELRHIFSHKSASHHLRTTKILVSSTDQQKEQQDWDEWALVAVKLGHMDTADLLYSTAACLDGPRDETPSAVLLKVGEATDMMLVGPTAPSSDGSDIRRKSGAGSSVNTLPSSTSLKRPLISRHSYSPGPTPRPNPEGPLSIGRASTNSNLAGPRTSTLAILISSSPLPPPSALGTSMPLSQPLAGPGARPNPVSQSPPSLNTPSMASSVGSSSGFEGRGRVSLAMPSMGILQRSSRSSEVVAQQQQQQRDRQQRETGHSGHSSGGPAGGLSGGVRLWGFARGWGRIDEDKAVSGVDTGGGGPSDGSGRVNTAAGRGVSQEAGSPGLSAALGEQPQVVVAALDPLTAVEDPGLRLASVKFNDDAALRHVAHIGDVAAARLLVGHGADVGARDGMPLALAAGGGHVEMVRFLVEEAGADVRAGGSLALSAAIASDQPEHCTILKVLLEKGANIHASDNFALRWACSHGRLNIAKLLVQYGADVSAGVEDALYQAAKNGHTSVVRMLLANGSNASKCRDAIVRAEAKGNIEIVKLLTKAAKKRSLLKILRGCFVPSPQSAIYKEWN